jgi:hypothetical protein
MCGSHQGIHGSDGGQPRLLDQPYNAAQQCTVRFVRQVRFATFDGARLLFINFPMDPRIITIVDGV